MASQAVKDAVKTRALTWASIASCPLHDLNAASDTPKAAYLDIEYPVADEERVGFGSPGLFRESGGIRFTIHVRSMSGVATALGWAETLRDLFREAYFSGVQCEEASPVAFDEGNNDGGYYKLPFVVTYEYDFEK